MTDEVDENFSLVTFQENANSKGDVKIEPIKRKEGKGNNKNQ